MNSLHHYESRDIDFRPLLRRMRHQPQTICQIVTIRRQNLPHIPDVHPVLSMAFNGYCAHLPSYLYVTDAYYKNLAPPPTMI